MKYRTLAISFLFFLFPFGELSASEATFNSQSKVLENKYLNKVAFSFNKKKKAEEYLDQAQQIIGDYSSILRENKKERREVVRLVKKSLKLKESARAYLFLGFVRHMAFDPDSYKDSVHYYEKALELKPKYLRALIALSSTHTNGKNYEACMNSTNQFLKLDLYRNIAILFVGLLNILGILMSFLSNVVILLFSKESCIW